MSVVLVTPAFFTSGSSLPETTSIVVKSSSIELLPGKIKKVEKKSSLSVAPQAACS